MLTRVHIKNYKSCKDVVLDDLGPMTALVGRNGSGKTNILRAIEWAANTATSTRRLDLPDMAGQHIVLEGSLDNVAFRYSIQAPKAEVNGVRLDSTTPLRETLELGADDGNWEDLIKRNSSVVDISGRRDPLFIGPDTPCLSAIKSLLPSTESVVEQFHPLMRFLRAIRYYPLDEPSETNEKSLIDPVEYQIWRARYGIWQAAAADVTRDASSSVLMRLVDMHEENRERFEEIGSLLGRDGLGLIDDIVIVESKTTSGRNGENEEKNWRFYFYPNENSSFEQIGFSYQDLSVGTRRILRILTCMFYDDNSVMLVEHPEDCIHRGLLRKLISLLMGYTDPGQFILTSHSAAALDSLSPTDLRFVTMSEGVTKVRAMDERELKAATNFLRNEGSLSELVESLEED